MDLWAIDMGFSAVGQGDGGRPEPHNDTRGGDVVAVEKVDLDDDFWWNDWIGPKNTDNERLETFHMQCSSKFFDEKLTKGHFFQVCCLHWIRHQTISFVTVTEMLKQTYMDLVKKDEKKISKWIMPRSMEIVNTPVHEYNEDIAPMSFYMEFWKELFQKMESSEDPTKENVRPAKRRRLEKYGRDSFPDLLKGRYKLPAVYLLISVMKSRAENWQMLHMLAHQLPASFKTLAESDIQTGLALVGLDLISGGGSMEGLSTATLFATYFSEADSYGLSILSILQDATGLDVYNLRAACCHQAIFSLEGFDDGSDSNDQLEDEKAKAAWAAWINIENPTCFVDSLCLKKRGRKKQINSAVPEEVGSPGFPLLTHIQVWLLRDKLEQASRLASRMDFCPCLDNHIKDEAWNHVFNFLLTEGNLFLDGNDKTPGYCNKRTFLYDWAIHASPNAISVMTGFYQTLARNIWDQRTATLEEKQYVLLACQQTVLRLFLQKYGLGHTTVLKFTKETLWPVELADQNSSRDLNEWGTKFLQQTRPIPISLIDPETHLVDLTTRFDLFTDGERAKEMQIAIVDEAKTQALENKQAGIQESRPALDETEAISGVGQAEFESPEVRYQGLIANDLCRHLEGRNYSEEIGAASNQDGVEIINNDDDEARASEQDDNYDEDDASNSEEQRQYYEISQQYYYADDDDGRQNLFQDIQGDKDREEEEEEEVQDVIEEEGTEDEEEGTEDEDEGNEDEDEGNEDEEQDEDDHIQAEMVDLLSSEEEEAVPRENLQESSRRHFPKDNYLYEENLDEKDEGEVDDEEVDEDDDFSDADRSEHRSHDADDMSDEGGQEGDDEEDYYNEVDAGRCTNQSFDNHEMDEKSDDEGDDEGEEDDDNGLDNMPMARGLTMYTMPDTEEKIEPGRLETMVQGEWCNVDQAEAAEAMAFLRNDVGDAADDIEEDPIAKTKLAERSAEYLENESFEHGHHKNNAGVDSDATDDEQEHTRGVEKAETEVAAVGGEFGDTTDEEDDNERANRVAQADRRADLMAQADYASQLEDDGYEPEDTHGYTEEEVSEAIHTEDEEEERLQAQKTVDADIKEGRQDIAHHDAIEADSQNVPHSSDDMDMADEHTEQEEDLGAESSELEDTAEGAPSGKLAEESQATKLVSNLPPPSSSTTGDPTTLIDFAQSAQRKHDWSKKEKKSTDELAKVAPESETLSEDAGVDKFISFDADDEKDGTEGSKSLETEEENAGGEKEEYFGPREPLNDKREDDEGEDEDDRKPHNEAHQSDEYEVTIPENKLYAELTKDHSGDVQILENSNVLLDEAVVVEGEHDKEGAEILVASQGDGISMELYSNRGEDEVAAIEGSTEVKDQMVVDEKPDEAEESFSVNEDANEFKEEFVEAVVDGGGNIQVEEESHDEMVVDETVTGQEDNEIDTEMTAVKTTNEIGDEMAVEQHASIGDAEMAIAEGANECQDNEEKDEIMVHEEPNEGDEEMLAPVEQHGHVYNVTEGDIAASEDINQDPKQSVELEHREAEKADLVGDVDDEKNDVEGIAQLDKNLMPQEKASIEPSEIEGDNFENSRESSSADDIYAADNDGKKVNEAKTNNNFPHDANTSQIGERLNAASNKSEQHEHDVEKDAVDSDKQEISDTLILDREEDEDEKEKETLTAKGGDGEDNDDYEINDGTAPGEEDHYQSPETKTQAQPVVEGHRNTNDSTMALGGKLSDHNENSMGTHPFRFKVGDFVKYSKGNAIERNVYKVERLNDDGTYTLKGITDRNTKPSNVSEDQMEKFDPDEIGRRESQGHTKDQDQDGEDSSVASSENATPYQRNRRRKTRSMATNSPHVTKPLEDKVGQFDNDEDDERKSEHLTPVRRSTRQPKKKAFSDDEESVSSSASKTRRSTRSAQSMAKSVAEPKAARGGRKAKNLVASTAASIASTSTRSRSRKLKMEEVVDSSPAKKTRGRQKKPLQDDGDCDNVSVESSHSRRSARIRGKASEGKDHSKPVEPKTRSKIGQKRSAPEDSEATTTTRATRSRKKADGDESSVASSTRSTRSSSRMKS